MPWPSLLCLQSQPAIPIDARFRSHHSPAVPKHGLPDRRAIRWSTAADGASRSHALLRFHLFQVKNLPIIQDAQKDRLAKLALQAVQIGFCVAPQVNRAERLRSKLEQLESQPVTSAV